MSITAWRLYSRRHATEAFTGEGARRYGGRWNSSGVRVVYASGSLSLAVLEILVHLESPEPLDAYRFRTAVFDEALVERVRLGDLPAGWQRWPAPATLRQIGGTWARAMRSAVLAVPSAVVRSEMNYLLNPEHPDFRRIIVGPQQVFRFDVRLFGR